MRKINHIKDIVDWGLCVGCGACAAICEKPEAIELINVPHMGLRPRVNLAICSDCNDCLNICPGYLIDAECLDAKQNTVDQNLLIGPTLEIWEGHAAEPSLRFNGSSGGILSAIAAFCIEKKDMAFVLHTGMDKHRPWLCKTVVSRNRSEIFSNAGSRYATSSPCEMISHIEQSDRPCVFIGKPCDAAAVSLARKRRPRLDQNLGAVLSFFCAGTPCTNATLKLIEELNIPLQKIKSLRYRGEGWPGSFTVRYGNGLNHKKLSYMDSWGKMASQRPFRCHLCPDGLGQFSDITSGDAWNKFSDNDGNPGLSHVLVRTIRGQNIISQAIEAGYLDLKPSSPSDVLKAQGLVKRRMHIFGRQLALQSLGIPSTRFKNFYLLKAWLKVPLLQQLRTILGTYRRIFTRGLWHKNPLF